MVDRKILQKLIRKKYGKYRPNAQEILQIIEENGLRNDKRKKGNKKSSR
jgi:hypothetical protein